MDKFLEHVSKGFHRFGVEVMSSEELNDGLQRMMLKDSVNDVYYAALARRKDASSPAKFWGKALNEVLAPLIKSAAEGGDTPPSALVVPSVEAETVLNLASNRGASPATYQLFDGYTVVGFKRSDSAALIKNLSPEKEEDKKTKEKELGTKEASLEEGKSSVSPRKLAAAALLGVSLASIPFALNKIKDNPTPPEIRQEEALSPEDAFIRDSVIEGAIEGRRENKELLAALALKSNLSTRDLKELSRSGYRLEVAANPHIGGIAEELAASRDNELRAGAASNPSLSQDMTTKAASDISAAVRRKAAAHPHLPLEALKKLAQDGDLSVRSAALENPNATEEILSLVEPVFESASCDNLQKIYASPCMPRSRLSYHFQNPDPCVRRGIAQNPNTPESVLKELAEDKELSVKRTALANPALKDIDISRYFPVGWLAEDNIERKEERKALLSNPNIPLGLLKSATLEKPSEYGVAAANNPKTPSALINALYNYAKGRGGVPAFFKELAALPQNAKFAADYRKAKARSPEEGDRLLKGAVKASFKRNIFNPIEAVGFAKGETPSEKEEKLALGDFKEGASEFFEDEGDLLAEGKGGFEEFFGEELLSNFEKETLKTADRAVDGALEELRPEFDGAATAEREGANGAGGTGGIHSGKGGGKTGNGASAGGSGGNAGGTSAGGVTAGSEAAGIPLFSSELFKTTCEDIEQLQKQGKIF